jgi:acyl carrier protein
MSNIEELIGELKIKIIETLGLIDVGPEDIKDDAPLVGGDMGIDSIDVLELVMMIEKDYSVKIESKELGVKVFESVRVLATHIFKNQRQKS